MDGAAFRGAARRSGKLPFPTWWGESPDGAREERWISPGRPGVGPVPKP
jgi:hypothetical protein